MNAITIRMSDEQRVRIAEHSKNVSEFVRIAIDNELERRIRPAAGSSGPESTETGFSRDGVDENSRRSNGLLGMSSREIANVWPKSPADVRLGKNLADGIHPKVIDQCNNMVLEISQEMRLRSLPRQICHLAPVSQGSIPRYKTNGETYVIWWDKVKAPKIEISSGDDFVTTFEIACTAEIGFDGIRNIGDISNLTSGAARYLSNVEKDIIMRMIDISAPERNRCTPEEIYDRIEDVWGITDKSDETIIVLTPPVSMVPNHIRGELHEIRARYKSALLIQLPSLPPTLSTNSLYILGPGFSNSSVIAVRQAVTVLPVPSDKMAGFCIFEEIGMGILDRSQIIMATDTSGLTIREWNP